MSTIIDRMFDLMEWYFGKYTDLNPLYAKLKVGIYYAYDTKGKSPVRISVPKSKRALPFHHYVLINQRPVFVGRDYDPDDEWDSDFKIDRSWAWNQDDGTEKQHLMTFDFIADAVKDNQAELMRVGFPYALPLADMSADLRSELYTKNLGDINERPKGVDANYAGPFLRALARQATYDARGDYYAKWRAGSENKPPYEANTTDPFIQEAFTELELVKDQIYVAIHGARGLVIYQIAYTKDEPHRVYYGGVPAELYLDPEFLKTRGKQPFDMVWIFAKDGLDKKPPNRMRKTFDVGDRAAAHEIADPQTMVEATIGKQAASQLNLVDAFDWFVELVTLSFPNRFYILDLRRLHNTWLIWGGLDLRVARDGIHPLVRDALKKDDKATANGAFTKAARARIEAALEDQDLLVIPQGMQSSKTTRFFGCDDLYAYERDLESGLIMVMPLSDYVTALAAAEFGRELYASTKWIIPMATFAAYAALVVVSFGVAAEVGVTATGVRTFVVNYARREITNKVLWEAVKRFGPALAALMTDLVLAFWDDPDSKNDRAGRWRHFARGFFNGYVVQTLYDGLFKRVLDTVTKGPKEYRMAVTIKKAYHTLDKIQSLVSRLETELEDTGIRAAIARFEKAVTHIVHGVALLMSAQYYVEHKDAAGMLDLFARGDDAKEPPSVEEWEAEATHQIAGIAKQINEVIDNFDKMDDVVAAIRDNKLIMAGAVLVVLRVQIWSAIQYTWSLRKKKPIKSKRRWAFYALAVAAVLLLASDQADQESEAGKFLDNIIDKIGTLLAEAAKNFPGRSENEAELYGKIVGNLIGGFLLNRFLFKEDHKFNKVFKTPILGATLKSNLKHGVVKGFLALVFKRYLSLYNDLVKHGVLSKARREEEFASLVDEVRDKELDARGLSHLKEFEAQSEKAMSLHDLFKVLLRFHRVLEEDGVELLTTHYGGQIARLKDDLAATAKLSDELGITDFAVEHTKALYVVMSTHVRLAVHELVEAMRNLFEPFVENGHFSWMAILKELGFDVGDVEQIQHEVTQLYKDSLGHFRASSD